MPLPPKLLNDGETPVVDLNPHWFHFATPVAALVGSLALGVYSLTVDDGLGTFLKWLSLGLIVVCAVWTLWAFVTWTTSHFVVTDDRIIWREGWIRKSGIDIPLERVNNVSNHQGVLERLFGAGDLVIESAGESGQQRFTDIRNPDQVQKKIYAQINVNEERGRGPVVVTDAATQLEKLEGMLQRGTLTQDEFDAQKRRLLG